MTVLKHLLISSSILLPACPGNPERLLTDLFSFNFPGIRIRRFVENFLYLTNIIYSSCWHYLSFLRFKLGVGARPIFGYSTILRKRISNRLNQKLRIQECIFSKLIRNLENISERELKWHFAAKCSFNQRRSSRLDLIYTLNFRCNWWREPYKLTLFQHIVLVS